jgi:c-di-GMP-binding flagellar brake protein YcgR
VSTQSSQTFVTVAKDDSWLAALHPGHMVELIVYGQQMVGKVLRIADDNITVRIPIEDQSGDLRRFSVTGTAVISIDGAAARVPVTGQSTGEFVRLQFIGPAEIIQRRLHVRVTLSVPVHLAWQSEPGGPWNWAESRTVDMSVGGVRVASARAVWPSIGEVVQVSMELPQGSMTEHATVIGKTPDYDLRLAFSAVSPQTQAAIEALAR